MDLSPFAVPVQNQRPKSQDLSPKTLPTKGVGRREKLRLAGFDRDRVGGADCDVSFGRTGWGRSARRFGDAPGLFHRFGPRQREWETKFRAMLDANELRDDMQRLSAMPHHLGSPYDKENAEWILSKFKEWGLDARIETFDVLFPTPKERTVELVEPGHFTAKLQEPAVAGDPTSGRNRASCPRTMPTRSTAT